MAKMGFHYRKPRLAVICHQFEREKIAPMQNFATKEKLGLAQKLPPPQKKRNKHCCHQIYIFDISISSKKIKND
jgi:hypothetical protein